MVDLWIPPEAKVAYRCSCGAEFATRESRNRHVPKCVRERAGEIQEMAHALNESALGGPLDREAFEWGRKRAFKGQVGFKRGRPA